MKTLLAEAAAEAAGGKGGEGGGSRAVVFANTKRAVGEIGQYCLEAGLPSTTLSGDHTQAEREVAIGRLFERGLYNPNPNPNPNPNLTKPGFVRARPHC